VKGAPGTRMQSGPVSVGEARLVGFSWPDPGPSGATGEAGVWLRARTKAGWSAWREVEQAADGPDETSRVISPAQRAALAVRDGGCGFPDCGRPLAWCEAYHLRHWLDGGPTDLANLALLCRAHHRAVHEGGRRLTRGPDGRPAAIPPHRRPQPAPAAA
jgi:hypothetical protein